MATITIHTQLANEDLSLSEILINGAWISVNNEYIRQPEPNSNWYDKRHSRVMRALHEFEDALDELIADAVRG